MSERLNLASNRSHTAMHEVMKLSNSSLNFHLIGPKSTRIFPIVMTLKFHLEWACIIFAESPETRFLVVILELCST